MLKDIFAAVFVAITTSAINIGVLLVITIVIEKTKEVIAKNRVKTHMTIIDVDDPITDEEDTWTIMGQ